MYMYYIVPDIIKFTYYHSRLSFRKFVKGGNIQGYCSVQLCILANKFQRRAKLEQGRTNAPLNAALLSLYFH